MKSFINSFFFIFVSGIGGLLLSLTGFSMGWVIGTLITAAGLSYVRPKWVKNSLSSKGIPKYWLNTGMYLLGIEIGIQINLAVITAFKEHFFIILFTLLLSIIFSLLTGFLLWKTTSLSMMTSFISTTPGGLSVMGGIADDVGANTAVVSIVQTIRVFMVVCTIPLLLSFTNVSTSNLSSGLTAAQDEKGSILWLVIFMVIGIGGYFLGKLIRIPAPWLVGTMIGIAITQAVGSSIVNHDLNVWWPPILFVFAQIFIGASIGSRIRKEMFIGVKRVIALSSLTTFVFISAMMLCSFVVSKLTNITFTTAALAFAPGGIAEMSTAALLYGADSTFVVAVQVIRVILVCTILPQLYKILNKKLA